MATMLDEMPVTPEGEKNVWQYIKNNLPNDIVCYYNREVKGREFDFCLLIKDVGFLILEVKGWCKSHVLKVESPDKIHMSDGSLEDSPKKQARSYAFKLKNIMNEKYNINPLVMRAVCYPFLSENDCKSNGLNVVSEPEYTFYAEDMQSIHSFSRKILSIYREEQYIAFDKMSGSTYDIARHHFEPAYIIAPPSQSLTPYSRVTVFSDSVSITDIDEIIKSYCQGTKQIVFTSHPDDLSIIAKHLSDYFTDRDICINGSNIGVMASTESKSEVVILSNRISIFNFEAVYAEGVNIPSSFIAYNGVLTDEQNSILNLLADSTMFNINQFRIEHAEVGRDIQVKAGAGTGKTYSMVSRIAFLCNQASRSKVYDPSSEIAMLTFTTEAALNMKTRLKQLFMNYYILTTNTKYLDLISGVEKMRISTIHSFAKEIIQNTATTIGIGTDFSTISGVYDKQKIFDRLFTKYLEELNQTTPLFFDNIPFRIEKFRKYLLEFSKKLYEKGCDIKEVSISTFGKPLNEIPYINDIFDKVVIATEKEYTRQMVENNAVNLAEYMIYLNKCIESESFNTNLFEFKYVFIDEFQDTDDAQISSFINMQQKLGFNLFIVGDLKQSIYRFRGATMTAFEKMGCNRDSWLSFTLNTNYRSDKRLLALFSNTFSYMGKKNLLVYDDIADHLEGIKEGDAKNEELIVVHNYDKNATGNSTEYYDKLFEVIEAQRQTILKSLSHTQKSKAERTIAILVRFNFQVDEILKEAKKRGVSVESDNNSDLYQLPPSIDLCKLTSALCNPYNSTYLFDLIQSRNVNVKFDIRSLLGKSDAEKTKILIDCLDKFFSLAMKKSWGDLIHEVQNEPLLKTLRLIYESTKPWKSYSSDNIRQEYYRTNYELVFEELSNMNKKNYLTLDMINESLHIAILTGTEAKSREIASDFGDVKIVCMTVHKSKGLEYGTVIMPRTDDEIDKMRRNGLEVTYVDNKIGYCLSVDGEIFKNEHFQTETEIEEAMMEESRILYVAMTRAINNFIWFDRADAKGNTWGSILKES